MAEIFFNEKINNYTFKEEIDGVKSIKREPIKFKLDDRMARFRKDILKEKILSSN